MKYRAEIDGLRALAVLPVILFHAGFEWFSGGFVGVDVFFVISGYLITTIIISEMAEGKFSIVNFYERRARRILPALFFVMAACLPFAWLWLTPTDLQDFGQSLVAVSAFSSNILFSLESGYFNPFSETKPLLHTWSLAVEEQFYILFPVLMLLMWRFGIKWILILLSFIFVLSLGVAHWGTSYTANPTITSASFYLLPTRAWELLIGVFSALFLKYRSHLKSLPINQAFSLAGLIMIFYSILVFDKSIPYPSFYALVPTLGAMLIIISAVHKTIVYKLLAFKPLVGTGLISYSAYLWHQPLLAFGKQRVGEGVSDYFLVALCALSFVMAYLSWRFIENPFRDKGLISRVNILTFTLIGIFFFSSLGLVTHLANGFTKRISTQIDYSTMAESPLRSQCHSVETVCEYFGDSIEWATFGDSHVVELSYALAEHLRSANIGVQHNSSSACKPSFNDVSSDCYEWTRKTIDRLVNSENIKNVVISFRLTWYMYGESLNRYPVLPNENSDKEREVIWDDLIEIFDVLLKNNKNIYFVIQPPELPEYVEKMAFWNDKDGILIEGVSRSWWDQRNAFVYDRLNDLPKEIHIIDMVDEFCDPRLCYGNNSQGYFYFDDDHLSVYGASFIIKNGIFRLEH